MDFLFFFLRPLTSLINITPGKNNIAQQDPSLIRTFRIRWRKTVANQLEIDLLSSSEVLLTLSTTRRVFAGWFFFSFPLLAVLFELCYLELSASVVVI